MKKFNKIFTFILVGLFAFSCVTDEDRLYSFDDIAAPANVNAVFDITQDNTGLVTILPNSEGGVKYLVEYGDGESVELKSMESTQYTYAEGVYSINITGYGITGLSSKVTKELNVTFKAPENLVVSIVKDASNPKIVNVSATADFATVMDVYFGEDEAEEPTHVLPGEEASHTYAEPGDYTVKVIAKSAGAATTEYTEVITIDAASDPVFLPVDFESFTVNYAFGDFGGAVSTVVDNPAATGINTSARVAQTVKTEGAEVWGGSLLTLGSPIDFSEKTRFTIKVNSPKVGVVVKMKVENLDDGAINMEVDAVSTVANEWEELSFDFSAIDVTQTYQKVIIFFDFGNTGDGSTYLFDDWKLTFAEAPSSLMIENFEGAAPEFTTFGNAGAEVVANPDASGENTTANVVKMTKAAGAETWAGAFFKIETPLDLDSYGSIKMKTWSPKVGAMVKFKLENGDGSIVYEQDQYTSVANAWETLTYDFSGAPAADFTTLVVFFDFGNWGDDAVYYYDEIEIANEDAGSSPLTGEWKIAPEAASIGVGPGKGDLSWWAIDDAGVTQRACFYDDTYVFYPDGSFKNVLGAETWVEVWQGGGDACGAPVAPYDGSAEATYTYDAGAGTITLNGKGAYLGIPKAVNGAELAEIASAPESVTYQIELADGNQTMIVDINCGGEVWWHFKMVKN